MSHSNRICTGAVLVICSLAASALSAGSENWRDTWYQYRIPVTVNFQSAGWNVVGLTPPQITGAINRTEELHYDPQWFAFNNLKVVELDDKGNVIGDVPTAGFYIVPDNEELLENGNFEKTGPNSIEGWTSSGGSKDFSISADSYNETRCLTIRPESKGSATLVSDRVKIQQGAYYLLSYRTRLDTMSGSPSISLRNSVDPNERGAWRDFPAYIPYLANGQAWWGRSYPTSYTPTLWPRNWTRQEQLMMPFFANGDVSISTRFLGTAQIDDVSLRKVRIQFLVNASRVGTRRWMIYYQPINTYNFSIPELRHNEMPKGSGEVLGTDTAERYDGKTRFTVKSTTSAEIWFAETTVKITPTTPVPTQSAAAVSIGCAKNEQQSFQLVIRPRGSFQFNGVRSSDLRNGDRSLPASSVKFQTIEYVFLSNPSPVTPTPYKGWIGDPLVEVQPKSLRYDNLALWVTVKVPVGAQAGVYKGSLQVEGTSTLSIPFELRVYDFQLPEYSPFRSSFGGPHITKVYPVGKKSIADFHHVYSKEDVKKLAHSYFELMAEHKFLPHNSVLYSEIGMNWTPPPDGYNVDKPGNFFKLHDWDFTEFNADLKRYVDELKVNSFAITHTNPSWTHTFDHLPGAHLQDYNRGPSFQCLGWHAFRKMLRVGYDKRKDDDYLEITQSQYDRLVLDFYRAMAENLEKHGWLDRAYILVDETMRRGFPAYLHFLRLMKSDPLTARIKIVWCIQGSEAFTHKEDPAASKGSFDGLIDVYVPETNESNTKWEKYFFSDYGIKLQREKLWNYVTLTSRIAIDAPGVTNRASALEVFSKGGGGYLIWETMMFDSYETDGFNPWKNPWTRWGNGAMSYFYPPRKDGPAPEPDWTITPSLRLMTFREGVDDYEYAYILEELVSRAKPKGIDVSKAEALLKEIDRFFPTSVHWSQNDAWYLDLRERLAEGIVGLQAAMKR